MELKEDIIERLLKLSKKYSDKPILDKVVIDRDRLLWSNGCCLLNHYYVTDDDKVIYYENNQLKTVKYEDAEVANYASVFPRFDYYEYFGIVYNNSIKISVFIAEYAIKYKHTIDYKKIEEIFSLIKDKELEVYIHKKQTNNNKLYPIVFTGYGRKHEGYFLLMPVSFI